MLRYTGDDAFCSKSTQAGYALTQVEYRDSIGLTNAAGVKAGLQANGPHSHISFKNIDIVHAGRGLVVENTTGSGAYPITDISFLDIRVEEVTPGGRSPNRRPIDLYINSATPAEIRNVTFTRIKIGNFGPLNSRIAGNSPGYQVRNVYFNDLEIAGQTILNRTSGQFTISNASNINFQ